MQTVESREPKRGTILQAAEKMFADRRFDEVTLDEIAAEAGVGKGTLYLYFKNKEDLFARMTIEGIDEMTARILAVAAMDLPFRERLALFARDYSSFLAGRTVVMRVMNQARSGPADRLFRKHHDRLIEAIHKLLRTGMEEGALRNDLKPAELRCALVGPLLLRVRREAHAGEKIDLDPLLDLFWCAARGGSR